MAAATDWALDPGNREETIRLLMSEEKLSRARAERNYGYLVPKCMVNQ
jgi:hypothetical protein